MEELLDVPLLLREHLALHVPDLAPEPE